MKKTNEAVIFKLKVVTTASVIIALLALTISLYASFRLQAYDEASMKQQVRMNAEISKSRFCHDKQIIPCDDIALDEWNKAHPNDVFNVMQ